MSDNKLFPTINRIKQSELPVFLDKVRELTDINFEITEKIDGINVVVLKQKGDVKLFVNNEQVDSTNSMWDIVKNNNLFSFIHHIDGSVIALHCVAFGRYIETNPYNLKESCVAIFDIFVDGKFLPYDKRILLLENQEIKHVPIVSLGYSGISSNNFLENSKPDNSLINIQVYCKGFVFKSNKNEFYFEWNNAKFNKHNPTRELLKTKDGTTVLEHMVRMKKIPEPEFGDYRHN